MHTQKIPFAILVGLGLMGGCDRPAVGPCLDVAPPDDSAPDDSARPCLSVEQLHDVGQEDMTPCLSPPLPPDVGAEPDTAVGPCLEVPPATDVGSPREDPPVGPCLRVRPPDPPVGPCLNVVRPPEPDDAPVGPCLKVRAPEHESRRDESADNVPGAAEGMARRDAVERFARVLPDDVLARLRRRS